MPVKTVSRLDIIENKVDLLQDDVVEIRQDIVEIRLDIKEMKKTMSKMDGKLDTILDTVTLNQGNLNVRVRRLEHHTSHPPIEA